MPFRHASRLLHLLLGVWVSPETARGLCEAVGKRVEDLQTVQAQQSWEDDAGQSEDTRHLAISADGAMVPLTSGEWAEVRTLAIGEVPTSPPPGEPLHVGALS
jgi:hypothetical protein